MLGLSLTEWIVIAVLMIVCTIGSFVEQKDINKED